MRRRRCQCFCNSQPCFFFFKPGDEATIFVRLDSSIEIYNDFLLLLLPRLSSRNAWLWLAKPHFSSCSSVTGSAMSWSNWPTSSISLKNGVVGGC